MLETFLLFIIFILGTYFGSFFTLATYRIPKHENITHKTSYCPNCKHRLGFFDLIPIFSYIFLGAKCRYCKKPIAPHYFIFEILSGTVFVLFAISLKINIYNLNFSMIGYFILDILYFTGLFIIAGIDKNKNIIPKSVLIYSGVISIIYMIYSYTLTKTNVYAYVIYLCFMIILIYSDTILLKRKLKYNYYIQLLILILYMLIFSGAYRAIYTVMLAILSIGFKNIFIFLKRKRTKVIMNNKKKPIAFFLCVANIIVIIITNFSLNYIFKI